MKAFKQTILLSLMWLATSTILAQTSAKIIRVVDGDTYQLLKDGKAVTVRLANVDAPELKQQYGSIAKQNVSDLILGKTVLIDSITKDRYNRIVASVWINGMALDSILVSNGWAWNYEQYNTKKELANYQQTAINEHLGLWKCGANNVCPPSVYRSFNAKNKKRYCNNCAD